MNDFYLKDIFFSFELLLLINCNLKIIMDFSRRLLSLSFLLSLGYFSSFCTYNCSLAVIGIYWKYKTGQIFWSVLLFKFRLYDNHVFIFYLLKTVFEDLPYWQENLLLKIVQSSIFPTLVFQGFWSTDICCTLTVTCSSFMNFKN